jgi:tetratricopeptide (TPR) repeat protein
MMQRRLPEALELLTRAIEVAPHVPYLYWIQRWLQPPVVSSLSWDVLFPTVVRTPLTIAVGVPVPPEDDDPRLIGLRAAAEVFAALRPAFPGESILFYGEALIRRRLGEPERTVEVAREGVQRWPDDWRLRTALLNAYRDAGRPDDALAEARAALDLTPEDFSPLHDAAWGFVDAARFGDAAQLFEELVQRDPGYPGAKACLHYTRWRSTRSEEDRQALIRLRERRWWDEQVRGFADEADPPVPYVNVLPGPGDATLAAARHLAQELGHVIRCCGVGGHVSLGMSSLHMDSPSVQVAFDLAMKRMGANGSIEFSVEEVQAPDPRVDKAQLSTPIWRYEGERPVKVHAEGDPTAQEAIASIARQPFGRDVWDPAARAAADQLGGGMYHQLLSVLTNPPVPTDEDDFDAFTWTWRCQVATALVLSHLGPWDTGSARAALYSMVYGPSDWVTGAAIIAFGWRVAENPGLRAEVEPIFQWLRTQIPQKGFTAWEVVLAEVWLGLGGHSETAKADLEEWLEDYFRTVPTKNVVRPPERRYAGMSLEEYVRHVIGGGPPVAEWQEALNASPPLHERFLGLKRDIELEGMGVTGQEMGAMQNILDGNQDMHLRMAQAQAAQRELNEQGDDDPDPEVFPGQPVARLSDYVAILKGMQSGDMNGALRPYGLDMMSYGTVAQAWGAKMAADPVLTEKFQRMMQS